MAATAPLKRVALHAEAARPVQEERRVLLVVGGVARTGGTAVRPVAIVVDVPQVGVPLAPEVADGVA